jgi:hypothetical protein
MLSGQPVAKLLACSETVTNVRSINTRITGCFWPTPAIRPLTDVEQFWHIVRRFRLAHDSTLLLKGDRHEEEPDDSSVIGFAGHL